MLLRLLSVGLLEQGKRHGMRMFSTSCACMNSNRASISRPHRHAYPRTYQTLLVQPDGSTINIRFHEPRRIIKMPQDVSQLTEAEKIARQARRKPKEKIVIEEEIEDTFDLKKYSHLWKKK